MNPVKQPSEQGYLPTPDGSGATSSYSRRVKLSIVVGILAFVALGLAIAIPALTRLHIGAHGVRVLSQAGTLAVGALRYAQDHDDTFPATDDWVTLLKEQQFITDDQLSWPSRAREGRCFAMNANLDGVQWSAITDWANTVLFFEVAPNSPLAGGAELLPDEPRWKRGYTISFVDGHSEHVSKSDLAGLLWEPK